MAPSTWLYSGCLTDSSNFEEAPRNQQVQTFTRGCFLTHFAGPFLPLLFFSILHLAGTFPSNQTSASPFKFPTLLEFPSTDQGAVQMLATHSLWQESVHVCFCRDMGVRPGEGWASLWLWGQWCPQDRAELWQGWDVGERRNRFCISISQHAGFKTETGQAEPGRVWGNKRGRGQVRGDRHASQAFPAFPAFNKHAHSRGEQQIKTCRVLAVQASGGWIIRALRRRGREGKVGEMGDHTGRQRAEPRSHLPRLHMPLRKLTDTPLARPRPVRWVNQSKKFLWNLIIEGRVREWGTD